MPVERVAIRVLIDQAHLLGCLAVALCADHARAEAARLVGHRAAAVYTYLSNLLVCLFELDLALFGRVAWLANVWRSDRYVIERNGGSIDTPRRVSISVGEPTHAISAVLFVIRKCGSFTDLFPAKSHVLV